MKTGTVEEKKATGSMDEATLAIVLELQETVARLELERVKGNPLATQVGGGITAEQLQQILDNQSNKNVFDQDLSKAYSDAKDIPMDDFDPIGVLFCCYCTGYVIADDKRNGFPVKTPYGRIFFFQLQVNQKVRVGNVDEMSSFSSLMCHSKKEQEWLRKHKYYNIAFFESAKEALNSDSKKVEKMMSIMNSLDNQNQSQIVNLCTQYGIGISNDMQGMRIQLARAVAESQSQADYEANKNRVVQAFEMKNFG